MSSKPYIFDNNEVIRETDKAVLIKKKGKNIWLPKSVCQFDGTYVMVPGWLAKKYDL